MDRESVIIKRYGILNEAQGEIPHPTALVIDRQGIIRFLRTDVDYTQRPPTSDLLEVLRSLK